MANNSYWNYINYQGAWSSTVVYKTQINTPNIGIGLSFISCPQVTYSNALYIATGYDSVSGLPAQPTLGSHPNVDTAWTLISISSGGGSGTVTSTSVVSANGLSGTVANPTTTPAITLAPTFTGFVYSNGSQLQAASTSGAGGASSIGLTGAASSWTPTLSCQSVGDLAVTYTLQYGKFSQIGNLVYVTFEIATTSFTYTTASGNLVLGGIGSLPLAGAPTINSFGAVEVAGYTKAGYTQTTLIANVSGFGIQVTGSGETLTNLSITDLPSGGTINIQGTICYLVA